ncbi:MAG: Macrolide export ATP-binding/permease protein MacB [Candidatus Ordinivivax streblomastigis]|jgi:putative ABC transport system permease protein|uniref:Macrolide export ATP-binding/permease protein MacB n=1 Tax=Candidatus Ordinivivax streblomastigis TaxID=2540710 RepID=A0A5M8NWV5_9BACT|nr:MAG: Macrolide export ATP-binding/permease protein MacB [Candidatus Ordinivivax streblomastigis]MDR2843059.1 ABC transporter permease [Candidatus Symbiothrix sp.]
MQLEENVRLAIRGLADHKFRSFLTMLGIIFGVASVITMLSIGEGAKREAIAKYQDLGVKNIIVREKNLSDEELEETRAKFSQGLSLQDAAVMKEIVPGVTRVAVQAEITTEVKYADKAVKSNIIGVSPNYLEMMNYQLQRGELIGETHYNQRLKVCVLGAGVAHDLFQQLDPVGQMVKIDDQWMEIVGVLASKTLFTETVGELAARDLNTDVYLPLSTFSSRFTREKALASKIQQITVQVENSGELLEASSLINEILKRHHFNNEDYSIVIPYELLKQEEKERQIYNFLLGAIAAISLLVGGIGIMNIMLATVMERTREIGIRRAIGARKADIMSQFVTEAVAISITGGIIGVLLGVSLSLIVSLFTDVSTFIRPYSIVIAFAFSVVVGISFGYLPAKNAAQLKPVDSIRYE